MGSGDVAVAASHQLATEPPRNALSLEWFVALLRFAGLLHQIPPSPLKPNAGDWQRIQDRRATAGMVIHRSLSCASFNSVGLPGNRLGGFEFR